MKKTLLLASLLVLGALACGLVALCTNHWTTGRGRNDGSFIGLWRYCLINAEPSPGTVVPRLCRDVERTDTTALLRLLGDSDADAHWDLFVAARVLMIVGMGLLGAAAVASCAQGLVPACPSRACILIPFLLTLAALACSVLVPIFWGVLQARAFNRVSWFDSTLGYSWILAVIAPGVALLALTCMLGACVTGWRGKGARRQGQRCCGCYCCAPAAVATTTTNNTTMANTGAPALLQPPPTSVMVAPAHSTAAYAADGCAPSATTTTTTTDAAGSSSVVAGGGPTVPAVTTAGGVPVAHQPVMVDTVPPHTKTVVS